MLLGTREKGRDARLVEGGVVVPRSTHAELIAGSQKKNNQNLQNTRIRTLSGSQVEGQGGEV